MELSEFLRTRRARLTPGDVDWAARAPRDRNWARITFLDPSARELFVDWDAKAADVVGQLRLDAGQHPNDPLLGQLGRGRRPGQELTT